MYFMLYYSIRLLKQVDLNNVENNTNFHLDRRKNNKQTAKNQQQRKKNIYQPQYNTQHIHAPHIIKKMKKIVCMSLRLLIWKNVYQHRGKVYLVRFSSVATLKLHLASNYYCIFI